MTQDGPSDSAAHSQHGSVRRTLQVVIIAFVLVLVFRAFFVEAFLIPTGSMAPTLLGRHLRVRSAQTGFTWAVSASAEDRFVDEIEVSDPAAPSLIIEDPLAMIRPGDRIFVMKFAYMLRSPSRWEVAVFKNPEKPEENFIKRLVGLPGETVWLVDGDVFTAPAGASHDEPDAWSVARKPARVQDRLWWPVFSSRHAPLDADHSGDSGARIAWEGPWSGDGWSRTGRTYRAEGAGPTSLAWNTALWPITDWTPYNDTPAQRRRLLEYPVSDLRLRAAVTPDSGDATVRAVLEARGVRFEGELTPGRAALRMIEQGGAAREVSSEFAGLPAGRPTNVALAHADQRVELLVDGRMLLTLDYGWGPWERLARSTGLTVEQARVLALERDPGALREPGRFLSPEARWEFDGAAITLARVGLDRDVHYQPGVFEGALFGSPGRATHPSTLPTLGPDEFFALGDNSGPSRDGRLWEFVDPWLEPLGVRPGVVHRDLLIGRAFFVYFPAPHPAVIRGEPVGATPDLGRVRFIR